MRSFIRTLKGCFEFLYFSAPVTDAKQHNSRNPTNGIESPAILFDFAATGEPDNAKGEKIIMKNIYGK